MTALSAALLLAIHQLDIVRARLQDVLLLSDTNVGERADSAATQSRLAGLTEGERQVVVLLSAGQSNKVIANSLGLAESTVKNRLSQIYIKLGVPSRTSAALLCKDLGLLPDDAEVAEDWRDRSTALHRYHPRLSRAALAVGPHSRLGPNPNVPRSHAQQAKDKEAGHS